MKQDIQPDDPHRKATRNDRHQETHPHLRLVTEVRELEEADPERVADYIAMTRYLGKRCDELSGMIALRSDQSRYRLLLKEWESK